MSTFGNKPCTPFDPSTTANIGAIAIIGTVCEATNQGNTARSNALETVKSTAKPSPTTPAKSNPSTVAKPVKKAWYGTEFESESGKYAFGKSVSN